MKHSFDLMPGCLGNIRIGMLVSEALSTAGSAHESFRRGAEIFHGLCDSSLQISEKPDGTVVFVEVFDPHSVLVDGRNLIGVKLADAKNAFKGHALCRILGSDGFVCLSRQCTVAVTSGKVSSVAIFAPGYYDGLPLEAL